MKRSRAAGGSALFFALAPGVVAGVVPWCITGWRSSSRATGLTLAVGLALAAAGSTVLVHAFWRFVRDGAGTPAPIAPTERLVVTGAYRHVRNPMYLAVLTTVLGQAVAFRSLALVAYGAAVLALTAAFVRWVEEPTLARRFGDQYAEYRRAVPGWWPRLRPWVGPGGPGRRPPPSE